MVTEKESIFSYLAGRDERYNTLESLINKFELAKQNGENIEDVNKELDE